MKSENRGSGLVAASICIVTAIVTLLGALWDIRPNQPAFPAALCLSLLMFLMGLGFALAAFGIIPMSRGGRDKK